MNRKIVPAVWFQNKLNPAPASVARPAVLELMESQLARVTGGLIGSGDSTTYVNGGIPNDTSDN
jgi:hypothetical protein